LTRGDDVEYRVGTIIVKPENDTKQTDKEQGLEFWVRQSEGGFPVGKGRVSVKYFNITLSDEANCTDFTDAAQELVDKGVDAVVIAYHNCKEELASTFGQAEIPNLLQSGVDLLDIGGNVSYSSTWYVHYSSEEYPRRLLQECTSKDLKKVAVMWWEGHDWARASARTVVDHFSRALDFEVVYTFGWAVEQSGRSISLRDDEYVEAYDTSVWDKMLTEAAGNGAQVLIIYCISEGVSIAKRIKALGLDFGAVYMTVTPFNPSWQRFLGPEGDFVSSPGQWHPKLDLKCEVYNSSAEYVSKFEEMYNHTPTYDAAAMTAAGVMIQLALQNSADISARGLFRGLESLRNDTMFGHIKFSHKQRNIGQPPVLMQYQEGKPEVVLPSFASSASLVVLTPSWECRSLIGSDPGTCDGLEREIWKGCHDAYPYVRDRHNASACEDGAGSGGGIPAWILYAAIVISAVALVAAAAVGIVMLRIRFGDQLYISPQHLDLEDSAEDMPVGAESSSMGLAALYKPLSVKVDLQPVIMSPVLPSRRAGIVFPEETRLVEEKDVTAIGRTSATMKQTKCSASGSSFRSRARQLPRANYELMKQLVTCHHHSIVRFFGYTSIDSRRYLVTEHNGNTNLRDLLNSMQALDSCNMIRIIEGPLSGLQFLHQIQPKPFVHGEVNLENLLVSDDLSCKLTCEKLLVGCSPANALIHIHGEGFKYWFSPERLSREPQATLSPSDDVYAVAFLLWEVFYGQGKTMPFNSTGKKNGKEGEDLTSLVIEQQLRPAFPLQPHIPSSLSNLIEQCWDQDPARRPTMSAVLQQLRLIKKQLEDKSQYHSAMKNTLMNKVFPPRVLEALSKGEQVEPEHYNEVTIMFSDIVGYTDLSSSLHPSKVMDMLSRLFVKFDELAKKHGLFKVETIGDAYMCVGGLPDPQPDHVVRVARMALDCVEAANSTLVDTQDEGLGFIRIRVGFHSGPVMASVVGDLNPRYCLFGDTVNTASRMETNSEANRVNCSAKSAFKLLENSCGCADLVVSSRGAIQVKGKGEMQCFWIGRSVQQHTNLEKTLSLPADHRSSQNSPI